MFFFKCQDEEYLSYFCVLFICLTNVCNQEVVTNSVLLILSTVHLRSDTFFFLLN